MPDMPFPQQGKAPLAQSCQGHRKLLWPLKVIGIDPRLAVYGQKFPELQDCKGHYFPERDQEELWCRRKQIDRNPGFIHSAASGIVCASEVEQNSG